MHSGGGWIVLFAQFDWLHSSTPCIIQLLTKTKCLPVSIPVVDPPRNPDSYRGAIFLQTKLRFRQIQKCRKVLLN